MVSLLFPNYCSSFSNPVIATNFLHLSIQLRALRPNLTLHLSCNHTYSNTTSIQTTQNHNPQLHNMSRQHDPECWRKISDIGHGSSWGTTSAPASERNLSTASSPWSAKSSPETNTPAKDRGSNVLNANAADFMPSGEWYGVNSA
jgi:hypothetical protein